MYNKSSKQQVIYSLEVMTQALFHYLQYRPLEDITISEICKKAGISRRTFYRNCEEKKDLIVFSTDRLILALLDSVDFHCRDAHVLYRNFFAYWYAHRDFLTLLYKRGLFDVFMEEFLKICNESLSYPLLEETLESAGNTFILIRYSNAFVIGGLAQMLKEWTEEAFQTSVSDVAGAIVFLAPVHSEAE